MSMKKPMINFLITGKYEDVGKLVIRLLFGLSLAINHGWPTFSNILSSKTGEYPDPLELGPEMTMILMGTSEFIFALMVVVGLFTRISVIPIIVGFTVAFFVHHATDPFGVKELSFLYLGAFTSIFFLGPGKFSLDYLLFKNAAIKVLF